MKIFLLMLAALTTTAAANVCTETVFRDANPRDELSLALQRITVATVGPEPPARLAHWREFPATCSFFAFANTPCSCVLVGPRTLLTAAHCLRNASGETTDKGTIYVFNPDGDPLLHEAGCETRIDLDLAICETSQVENISFETLSGLPLGIGTRLLLTGFGTNGAPASGGSLRRGFTTIISTPGVNNFFGIGGETHLFDGDSGGPAYILLSTTVDGSRLVAGINANDFDVTSVSTPAADAFIRAWAQALRADGTRRNAQICGINAQPGTQRCRS